MESRCPATIFGISGVPVEWTNREITDAHRVRRSEFSQDSKCWGHHKLDGIRFRTGNGDFLYIYIYKRFCRLRKIREIWDCPEKESGYGESNNIVYKYPFVSSFIPKLTFERRDKCVNHEKFYYASSLSSSGRNLHGGNSARHQLHPPKCTLPSCLTEWRHTGGAITELRPL